MPPVTAAAIDDGFAPSASDAPSMNVSFTTAL